MNALIRFFTLLHMIIVEVVKFIGAGIYDYNDRGSGRGHGGGY